MTGRHLTTAVTLLVLCGLLLIAAVVGAKALLSPFPGSSAAPSAAASPSCTVKSVRKGQKILARQVVVSVFNAGNRPGLADLTLNRLHRRGFQRGTTGNITAMVRFVQVWTTHKQDPTATLVARQFGPGTLVRVTKQNLGPGIAVVVGNDFNGLQKAPSTITAHTRQQVCLP